MLRLKNLFENYPLAKYVLNNYYEYSNKELDKMLSYFRASCNIIYPYRVDKKVRFLRLAPVEEKSLAQVQAEIDYIQYLRSNGYNAVTPVSTLQGDLVMQIDTPYGQYVISCFENANGVTLEETDLNDKIMIAYGEALGQLHALSRQYGRNNANRPDYIERIDWAIDVFSTYECDSQLIDIAKSLKEQMSTLIITDTNYGLIHYDFQPDNIFYDKKSNQCTVIDFDDCMYGWYAIDIMRVFDSLEQMLDDKQLSQAREEFMQGYKQHYTIDDGGLDNTAIFSKYVDIITCASIIYTMGEELPQDQMEEWVSVLCDKLINMVNSIVAKLKGEDKVLEDIMQLAEQDVFDNQCD
ncbi:MAG: phosphotransferase [Clostridia bacterium]|nr:phosphotransferase [Clostridia bacterium]